MKIVFLAGLICALCLMNVTKAAPADGDNAEQEAVTASTNVSVELEQAAEAAENADDSNRENIGTCSFGSGACTAHCWALGRWGGGYCSGGTCYCR